MPNRILKEGICTSEQIDKLSSFQEVTFYRLMVNCDDFGIMDARPRILNRALYPLKNIRDDQVMDAITALSSMELVVLYEVDGQPFLRLTGWDRHQTPKNRRSKYPLPDGTIGERDKANGRSFVRENPSAEQRGSALNNVEQHGTTLNNVVPNILSYPIQSVSVSETRTREDCDCFGLTLEEASARSQLLDEIIAAAADINLSTRGKQLDKINQLCADYSPEWVLMAISRTADASQDKWSWFYVRKVLQGWREEGGPEGCKRPESAQQLPPGFKHVRPPRGGDAK